MSPDLLETFAQASRRFSKVQRELRDELLEEGGDATQVQAKPKKLKMFEWRAFQRMQNRVAFTAHPATEYFEATKVGEFDYVVLRKAYLAEKALPRLLDAIRDQTLWRREAEAARDATRTTTMTMNDPRESSSHFVFQRRDAPRHPQAVYREERSSSQRRRPRHPLGLEARSAHSVRHGRAGSTRSSDGRTQEPRGLIRVSNQHR